MPKITKKGSYNLNDRFASTIVEASYTQNDFKNLIMWVQPDSTTALKDGSSFNHTIVETSLVSVGKNRITDQGYEQAFSSVNFNGSASQFRVADADVFSFTDGANNDKPFSASIWVRFTNLSQIQGLFGKAASTSTREYFTSVSTAGAISFQLFDESANHAITKTSIDGVVVANTWHHVVVTYDGSEGHAGINIYVDGVLTTSQSAATGGSYAGSENLGSSFFVGLGMDPSGSGTLRYLKGDVGGFALWSKKLASTAVTALYHRKGYNAYRSGFLNNPVRTIIRDRDNHISEYPTIHRMNRKDTTGILPGILFDDNRTVKFGNLINDDFTIEEATVFTRKVNTRLWDVSTTDVLIKKEFNPGGDLELTTGAVVLAGVGDTDGRWIQTKNKVGNPTLAFSLLQGPYGTSGVLSRFTLNLGEGKETDVFKVQASLDGSNWTDVKLKNVHLGAKNRLIVNEITNEIAPINISDFTGANEVVNSQFKPLHKIKIDPIDFARSGFTEPFYIRFIQTSISDTNIAVWAIGNIKINSRNEQVEYPFLGTGTSDSAALHYLNKTIATPNLRGGLISSGSSITGITDLKPVPDIKTITPFDENITIQNNNSGFFNVGTQESITPGFSRPLSSKTIINYHMNPSDSDVIGTGLTRQGTAADVGLSNDDGQVLLSYWNFKLNRWEEVGQPLRDNRGNHASQAAAHEHLYDNITGSCAGFGPGLDSLVEGKVGKFNLKPPKAFEYAYLPISTFGFPNAAKYHATSSQHVTAKDLGITKPFLLEKLSLDFDMKFTVPGTRNSAPGSGADADAFTTIAIDTETGGSPYEIRRLKIMTPTFFLLRQTTKKNSAAVNAYTTKTPGTLGFPGRIFEPIPKAIKLASGSLDLTTIFDTRELITYGQYSLFVTASDDTAGTPDRLVDSSITMADVLNSGIVRDGFTVKEIADAETDNTFHIKDRINFPSRIAARHSDVLSVLVHNNQPAATNGVTVIKLENANESRLKSLDGACRAIVNGVTNTRLSNPQQSLIVSQSLQIKTVITNESLVFDSPYLILPEDKIIFGWQYPMPRDLRFPLGIPGNTPNAVKIQSCNLKMFGSQIKNGKEFHEGLNQNLVSSAIHEVIGSEPVIDQWQVATRNEMTGSLSDQFMFAIQTAPAGTEDFTLGYVIGKIISPPPDSNTRTRIQLLWNVGNNPVRRVNSRFNATLGNSFSLLGDKASVIKVIDDIDGPRQPANSYYHQIQAFTSLVDIKRVYSDSTILNGSDATLSYGSSQNYTYFGGGSSIIKLGGSPKYYFSLKHYGYFSDLIRQGLDSKSESVIERGFRTVVEPAVRIRFVEDDYDEENLNFRKFSLVKPSDIDGTAYETFQSSNISLFATSSLPFKEGKNGSVNDDVPTNRTYSISAVEVS